MLPTLTAASGREFTCFPAAILVFLINQRDEILLLSEQPGRWSIIAGAIEAGETILGSALRELREETGGSIRATPIGVAHAHTYHYDAVAQNMISVYYVMRHERGEVVPGDDMAGARHAWWSLEQIRERMDEVSVPAGQVWLFERALQCAHLGARDPAELEYFVSQES